MNTTRRILAGGLGIAGLLTGASTVSAQATDDTQLEEIVVTGYRGTLLNSTNAKRESVGFGEVIFADDIGKLPSQNLAESISRIPGVKIARDVTGHGLYLIHINEPTRRT